MIVPEPVIDLSVKILTVIICGSMGRPFHEALHWICGYRSGADPQFIFDGRLPSAVDFQSPESMSNRQIRITGGIVLVFPLGFLCLALIISPTEPVNTVFIGLFILLWSGSGISETDIIAMRHPIHGDG